MAVTASWISKKPDRCGGDACVRDTRITVWGRSDLIEHVAVALDRRLRDFAAE